MLRHIPRIEMLTAVRIVQTLHKRNIAAVDATGRTSLTVAF